MSYTSSLDHQKSIATAVVATTISVASVSSVVGTMVVNLAVTQVGVPAWSMSHGGL